MRPVVFAGPSIHGIAGQFAGLDLRGPAACGDILDAVGQGIKVIGLIDGLYGDCAAVWHKEILYALSAGVTVFGAASMGALRAAECAAFGMIGIGHVFEDYRDGRRFSDADVAVNHAPRELGYSPLTRWLMPKQRSRRAEPPSGPQSGTPCWMPPALCISPAGPGAPSPRRPVSKPRRQIFSPLMLFPSNGATLPCF